MQSRGSLSEWLTSAYLRLKRKYRQRFSWVSFPALRPTALATPSMEELVCVASWQRDASVDVQLCGHGAF